MNVTIAVGVVPIVATMLVVGLAVVIVVVAVVSVVVVTGSRKFLHSINQFTILNHSSPLTHIKYLYFSHLPVTQSGKAVPASTHEITCPVSVSVHMSAVPLVQVLICV